MLFSDLHLVFITEHATDVFEIVIEPLDLVYGS